MQPLHQVSDRTPFKNTHQISERQLSSHELTARLVPAREEAEDTKKPPKSCLPPEVWIYLDKEVRRPYPAPTPRISCKPDHSARIGARSGLPEQTYRKVATGGMKPRFMSCAIATIRSARSIIIQPMPSSQVPGESRGPMQPQLVSL